MTVNRCQVPLCYHWVLDDEQWCEYHHPDKADPEGWAEAFRTRLLSGDHAGLIGAELREVLAHAASDRTLTNEIGALRLALVRVLVTEKDGERLALTIARLVSVLIQAARARQALGDGSEDKATAMLRSLIAVEEDTP